MDEQLTESMDLPDPGLEPYGDVDESAPSDEAQYDVVEVEEQP